MKYSINTLLSISLLFSYSAFASQAMDSMHAQAAPGPELKLTGKAIDATGNTGYTELLRPDSEINTGRSKLIDAKTGKAIVGTGGSVLIDPKTGKAITGTSKIQATGGSVLIDATTGKVIKRPAK